MRLQSFFGTSVLSFALASCALSKPVAEETFSDLGLLEQKSDAFSYRLKLLGTLEDGASRNVLYTSAPRFRGFDFYGAPDTAVDLWVRGTRGDAVAWLLDGSFNVVATNDDADESTLNAHISAVLPSSKDNRFYLVFRDYYLESRRFTVEFSVTPAVALDCISTADAAGEECGGFGYNESECLFGYLEEQGANECFDEVQGRLYDNT